ncbi:DDE-type integrase/transposase/recombinase [Roseomonas sp. KE2513]|uniref:DDE-type integrase/transposase/recombinase n=1 Tax=Roseomonas sp. KE2513 TaxID=2479202 RepID=UPI0021020C37|nr:DDE-type integrase/transposase/recombinase [Roseomonas sp. KE2513]
MKPDDTRHLDEGFCASTACCTTSGAPWTSTAWCWTQDRRNGSAAKRFFKRLLSGFKYKPRRLVTDGLKSYGVAQRELLPNVRHRSSRYLNNQTENSHRPTRRRERQMKSFKSAEQAQRFLSAHSMIYGHLRHRRHLMTAGEYQRVRTKAFRIWQQETCAEAAP